MQIYAIQRESGGAVKIGSTRDIAQRLRGLQTSCDEKLVVQRSFHAGRRVEKALHYLLCEHRVAGEWFRDAPEVWDALDRAERGELWAADDWVPFASRLRKAGMTYESIGSLLGYSREYVRQQLSPYRQPVGCALPSKIKEAASPELSVQDIAERVGCSPTTVRKYLPRNNEEKVPVTGIDKVIAAAGGQTALADVLGVSQQAVSKWQKRGFVPAERVDQLAANFNVERGELIDPAIKQLFKGE